MQKKSLEDIESEYNLELERIVKTIKKNKAKRVLLQFPDGLKPYATSIKEKIEKQLKQESKSNCEIFIWLDTCFGACDVPLEVEKLGIDLIVQFGHSDWKFKN
jgi:2-(3-amino-3-carboxypropyl)histidine synthase